MEAGVNDWDFISKLRNRLRVPELQKRKAEIPKEIEELENSIKKLKKEERQIDVAIEDQETISLENTHLVNADLFDENEIKMFLPVSNIQKAAAIDIAYVRNKIAYKNGHPIDYKNVAAKDGRYRTFITSLAWHVADMCRYREDAEYMCTFIWQFWKGPPLCNYCETRFSGRDRKKLKKTQMFFKKSTPAPPHHAIIDVGDGEFLFVQAAICNSCFDKPDERFTAAIRHEQDIYNEYMHYPKDLRLLLCVYSRDAASPFYKEKLPLDMFKSILRIAFPASFVIIH